MRRAIDELKWIFRIGWTLTDCYPGFACWHIVEIWKSNSCQFTEKVVTHPTRHWPPEKVSLYVAKRREKFRNKR